MRILKLVALLSLTLLLPSSLFALDAFPGAEGYGKNTTGGRGGTVYIVDTLSDNPVDGVTFREACEASGARYVVFAVSGVIDVSTVITIAEDDITIAGQTSPGGVTLIGQGLNVEASNVIITHFRVRAGTKHVDYEMTGDDIRWYTVPQFNVASCSGDYSLTDPDHPKGQEVTYKYPCVLNTGILPTTIHALTVLGPDWAGAGVVVDNVIIDHCSFAWGCDETAVVSGGTTNITLSNCIFDGGNNYTGHDTQPDHSKGLLIAAYDDALPINETLTLTGFRNLVTNSYDRMPLFAAQYDTGSADVTIDWVNNVSYGWGGRFAPRGRAWAKINYVHNYMQNGTYGSSNYELNHSLHDAPSVANTLYVYGNLGVSRTDQGDAQWSVGNYTTGTLLAYADWGTAVRHDTPAISTEQTMSYAIAIEIAQQAGASVPAHDAVDLAAINDFVSNTGGTIPINKHITSDYPTYPDTALPTDSDSDGMADSWEISTFGDLDQGATDDFDADGYNDIEEYFHYLASGGASASTAASKSTAGTACKSTAGSSIQVK